VSDAYRCEQLAQDYCAALSQWESTHDLLIASPMPYRYATVPLLASVNLGNCKKKISLWLEMAQCPVSLTTVINRNPLSYLLNYLLTNLQTYDLQLHHTGTSNKPKKRNMFWWRGDLRLGFRRKQSRLEPDSSRPFGVWMRMATDPFCSSSHTSAIDSLYPPPQSSTLSPDEPHQQLHQCNSITFHHCK